MAVELTCPNCGNHVSLSADWSGKRVQCRCGEMVQVPSAAIQANVPLGSALPPPTPHLQAAARRDRSRDRDQSDHSTESILPWLIVGLAAILIVLLGLGVGAVFWLSEGVATHPGEQFAPAPTLEKLDQKNGDPNQERPLRPEMRDPEKGPEPRDQKKDGS